MKYDELKRVIKQSSSIVLFTHINPDGDTIGSALAFNIALNKYFSKNCDMILLSEYPQQYSFLPYSDKFKSLKDIENKDYDLAIAIDVASKDRMSINGLEIYKSSKCTVNIDHHKTNDNYGDLNFVDAKASCAGLVVFEILKHFNVEIDEQIATCIYTTILADTGGFRYENTKYDTLEVASQLIKSGASPSFIARNCFEKKSKQQVLLHAYCIQKAKFLHCDKVCYTTITNDELKKNNAKSQYTEGIVEQLRQIDSVEVAILFKEINSQATKISLRSKTVDVCKICEKFSGGGHKFASGCTINKPLNIAMDKILNELENLDLVCF